MFLNGIIAGCFDVIHPGYICMFRDAKQYCDHLTIALHTDPTVERSEKIKPILTTDERKQILYSIKYIDTIITYQFENDLKEILKSCKYNVRILGDDYKNKYATGQEYSEKIIYLDRSHGWSTTKYKKLIAESLKGK